MLLSSPGFSLPLADPDLPMHLATGEWIAKRHCRTVHRAVRVDAPGAPFQAYSWAIELAYFELMAHVGPLGLSVLQGSPTWRSPP